MKTLYHNGQFVPMTSEDDTFEALLVADDGTIAFTGSLVEARERAEDASEIDLAGKTVLPGFIDGHSHFTGTTQYLLNPDLSACRSFADIQNVLRDFIQKRGPRPQRHVRLGKGRAGRGVARHSHCRHAGIQPHGRCELEGAGADGHHGRNA